MIENENSIAELYNIDGSHWGHRIKTLLKTMGLYSRLNYECEAKEFLYVHTNYKYRLLDDYDKERILNLRKIASFDTDPCFKSLICFAISIDTEPLCRNEDAAYYTRLFNRIFDKQCILCIEDSESIAFTGLSKTLNYQHQVVISEWFSSEMNQRQYDAFCRLDFAEFDCKSTNAFYMDYIAALSRPYILYPESDEYLLYGMEDYGPYEEMCRSKGIIARPKKSNRDLIIEMNSSYYKDIYGDDYFVDEEGGYRTTKNRKREEDIEFNIDDDFEEDDDLDWTILEMELEEDMDEDSDEYLDDKKSITQEETSSVKTDPYKISNFNPSEMLAYIQRNT
ncbi:hypothetical protein [Oribacterium sp. Sow4_G1_1]|uniref:hypothetical protein n=1 Tax=Oribacterium sp. Sow4_G1_1 TaxID=3438794 RepID=UPI003F9C9EE1